MSQPQPLSFFKDQILQSEDIQKLIAEEYGPEADAALGRPTTESPNWSTTIPASRHPGSE